MTPEERAAKAVLEMPESPQMKVSEGLLEDLEEVLVPRVAQAIREAVAERDRHWADVIEKLKQERGFDRPEDVGAIMMAAKIQDSIRNTANDS